MKRKPSPFRPRILVSSTQRKLQVPSGRIRRLVLFVASSERRPVECIDVAVVGRRRMASLNGRYLGRRGPTDVLSFDLGPSPAGGICAQIVVCSDVAICQGRVAGHAAAKELLLYVTHGLLHVMGYDDHTPAQAGRMRSRENRLLEAFGLGRVYGDP